MSGNSQAVDRHYGDSQGSGAEVANLDMSIEAQARRLGWYPLDEFHGDPDAWVDAKSFVDRAHSEMPILRENLRRLDTKAAKVEAANKALSTKLSEMNAKVEEMGEAFESMRGMASKAEQRGFERAMEQIKKDAAEAAAAGDAVAATKAIEDAAELVSTRIKPDEGAKPPKQQQKPAQQQGQVDPVAAAWAAAPERAWFRENPVMKEYANAVFLAIQDRSPEKPMAEKLAEIDKQVANMFSDSGYFSVAKGVKAAGGDPPVNASSSVSRPDSSGGNKIEKAFAALEKEVRDEYARIARNAELRKGKPGYRPYTKAEFLKQYNGTQED